MNFRFTLNQYDDDFSGLNISDYPKVVVIDNKIMIIDNNYLCIYVNLINDDCIYIEFNSVKYMIDINSAFGSLIKEIHELRNVKYETELFNGYILRLKFIIDDFVENIKYTLHRITDLPYGSKSAK